MVSEKGYSSNFKPEDLYPNGLHRDRIFPAMALLNEKLEVVNVDNGTDYRRRMLEQLQLYHVPHDAVADAAMRDAFDRLAETQDEKMYRVVMDRERWFSVVMGESFKVDARTTEKLAHRVPLPTMRAAERSDLKRAAGGPHIAPRKAMRLTLNRVQQRRSDSRRCFQSRGC